MVNYKTYYFYFDTPLHLGNARPDGYEQSESVLHSDTITAAVLSMWARMGHVDWIEESKGDPDFVISSAFPFVESSTGSINHFFPRPLLKWERTDIGDAALNKKIKAVQWLDQYYFEKVINSQVLDNLNQNLKPSNGVFLSKEEVGKVYIKEIQERVVVPRDYEVEKDATPFVMERIRFQKGSGLYILVQNDNVRLTKALELLQYEGFGTDRNIGNGQFLLKQGTLELTTSVQANMATNLSLYCPESKETLSKQLSGTAAYSLLRRGGWVTSESALGTEKNTVYMFSEGSVFNTKERIAGLSNIDLTPSIMKQKGQHPIYRSGRSLFVPIKL